MFRCCLCTPPCSTVKISLIKTTTNPASYSLWSMLHPRCARCFPNIVTDALYKNFLGKLKTSALPLCFVVQQELYHQKSKISAKYFLSFNPQHICISARSFTSKHTHISHPCPSKDRQLSAKSFQQIQHRFYAYWWTKNILICTNSFIVIHSWIETIIMKRQGKKDVFQWNRLTDTKLQLNNAT